MKKLITAALTLALAASLSLTAFAADTSINQDTPGDPKTGSINLTYSVDPTYTVTIPTEVTLGSTATISAENVVVEKGKQVEVALTGVNEGGKDFTVTTEQDAVLTYTVTKDNAEGESIAIDTTVLAVEPGSAAAGSVTLSFNAPADAQFSGEYTGTVTFTFRWKRIKNK